MSSTTPTARRTNLTVYQIKALQASLDATGRGKIIDVPFGTRYEEDLESIAMIGEDLTARFTGHFVKGGSSVRFLMLDSEQSNAYAYWMKSFEAICLTSTMAREIDTLSDYVGSYIVRHVRPDSGFAYLGEIDIPVEHKRAMLKGLLIQGAMAILVGHEAGHLAAGHGPVFSAAVGAAAAENPPDEERELFVDDFIAMATDDKSDASGQSLRYNAHEVDADVQGLAMTSAFWLSLQSELCSAQTLPYEATLIRATCERPERLLLLVSTGAAIAISLMGYKKFTGDWDKQATHPLTAVRCVVGLAALGRMLSIDNAEHLPLRLRPECAEALTLVHSRLGSMVLAAAKHDGRYSNFTSKLQKSNGQGRLRLMFRATGVAQAMAKSNDVVRYLEQLSEEFNACASLRGSAIRVSPKALARWTA